MIAIYVKPTGADCSVHADYGKPRPMEVTIFTGVKDDTIVEFAFTKAGSAKDWPRVTLGELRAWLKERATAVEKQAADAALLAAMTSPGANAETAAGADLTPPCGHYVVTAGACPDCTRIELAKHAARVTASGVAVEAVTTPVIPLAETGGYQPPPAEENAALGVLGIHKPLDE